MKATHLHIEAEVRHWEDATVNGVEDEDGVLIPCRQDDSWCPIIELESGKIINWNKGVEADIHYKVCDAGTYALMNNNDCIVSLDGYVPELMSPKEPGYGDYIIMDVDKNGVIKDWKPVFTEFEEELKQLTEVKISV